MSFNYKTASCFLLILLGIACTQKQTGGPELTVEISHPPLIANSQQPTVLEFKDQSSYLDVSITNVSNQTMRFWSDCDCCLGKNVLSFITTAAQQSMTVPIMFGKLKFCTVAKFEYWMLNPNEKMIIKIPLHETSGVASVATALGFPDRGKTKNVTLQVQFTIEENSYTKKYEIWTGEITSGKYDVDLSTVADISK